MRRRRRRFGYSLVEVIVALVLLQVGLLGVAGMVLTAGRALAGAARTDRALALGEAVADSLLAAGWAGPGARAVGPWEVRWSGAGAWALVEVGPRDGEEGPAVRIPVPVEEP